MTRKKKILFSIFTALIVIASIWTYKIIWGKPFMFNHFVERAFLKEMLTDPEYLTYYGSNLKSNQLTDISSLQNKKNLSRTEQNLKTLHSYDKSSLTPQEKLTYEILEAHLNHTLELNTFEHGTLLEAFTPYPVNKLFGMQSSLVEFMINVHPIKNKKSSKNYISRLSQFNTKFDQIIEELKLRESKQIIPPLFVIEAVINEANDFIAQDPEKNVLYTSFQNKLDKTKINEKDKIALENETKKVIENSVYPAYAKLVSFLETQKKLATNDDGVWKFPNGDKFYEFCLKYHTTTDYTASEIHQIGLSEVHRIHSEMREILDTNGYKEVEIATAFEKIKEDPNNSYPENENSRMQVIKDYNNLFAKIQDQLTSLFNTAPKAKLKIIEVPDFKAKTSPVAYYQPPAMDGSRPGIFYVNAYNLKDLSKITMPSIAYHEGVPGHHYQISIAQELKNIPTFRKVVHFTSYIEGWALYCEQLAWENDFYSDPFSNLGRLQMEILRAARLVVDTGIHHLHWTRDQAIDYMIENTFLPKSDVVAEVERYIVIPGQACAYKIGMLKILELREKMNQNLAEKFDIKEFHDIILQNGALPLNLLEKMIDEKINN